MQEPEALAIEPVETPAASAPDTADSSACDSPQCADAVGAEVAIQSNPFELKSAPEDFAQVSAVAPLAATVVKIEELEKTITERLRAVESVLEELRADQSERQEHARNREALYEKLEAARPSFVQQLTRPFVQRLTGLHDLLADMRTSPPTASNVATAFDLLLQHLEETLALQGIERFSPAVNDPFDSRLHYVITTQPTSETHQHSLVASVVQNGFASVAAHDRTGEIRQTIIRPARVIVWRHDPNLATAQPAVEATPSAEETPSAAALPGDARQD